MHYRLLPIIGLGALLALCLPLACTKQPAPRRLLDGREIMCPSPGKRGHDFVFMGNAGQYAEIKVTQLGTDVEIEVWGPDDIPLYRWDSPYSHYGTELICFLVPQAGRYVVRITAYDPGQQGEYRILYRSLAANEESRARAAAFALVHRAASLDKETESLAQLLDTAADAWQALGDDEQAAMTLWRKTLALRDEGSIEDEITCLERAISLLERAGQPVEAAMVRHYLADSFYRNGRLGAAIAHYEMALRQEGISTGDRAAILEAMGKTSTEAGFFEDARPLLEEALLLNTRLVNTANMASVYGGLGWLHHRLGNFQEALDLYELGLQLSRDRYPEISLRLVQYRAKTWTSLGEPRKALESLEAGVARIGWSTAPLAVNMADSLLLLGDFAKAREKLLAVLPHFRGRAVDLPYILYKLAVAERGLGHTAAALAYMEEALPLTARLGSVDISASRNKEFIANRYEETAFMLDLLVETSASPAPRAFGIAAATRFNGLPERAAEASATQPEDPNLEPYRAALADTISGLIWQKKSDIHDLDPRLDTMIQKYEALEQLRTTAPTQEASITEADLFEMAKQLPDPETTLLFFAMGLQKAYLWTFSKTGANLFELGSSQMIDGLARDYHRALAGQPDPKRSAQSDSLAKQLSGLIFEKAWPALQCKRLVVIADGGLQNIPLQALPLPQGAGEGLLANRFEVVYLPSIQSAGLLTERAQKDAGQGMLMLADPNYGEDFARLSGSREEAEAISRLGEAAGLKTWALLGLDASREGWFNSPFLAKARYLHISSHALYFEDRPELSALVLSTRDGEGQARNGFVRLNDITGLKLQAQLVVLSACRTALGKELRGTGILGFANAFFQAGCQGVIVSLWRVDDRATAELMQRFYREHFLNHVSPAQALRRAQMSMAADPQWHNPYYWAGFNYQGTW